MVPCLFDQRMKKNQGSPGYHYIVSERRLRLIKKINMRKLISFIVPIEESYGSVHVSSPDSVYLQLEQNGRTFDIALIKLISILVQLAGSFPIGIGPGEETDDYRVILTTSEAIFETRGVPVLMMTRAQAAQVVAESLKGLLIP